MHVYDPDDSIDPPPLDWSILRLAEPVVAPGLREPDAEMRRAGEAAVEHRRCRSPRRRAPGVARARGPGRRVCSSPRRGRGRWRLRARCEMRTGARARARLVDRVAEPLRTLERWHLGGGDRDARARAGVSSLPGRAAPDREGPEPRYADRLPLARASAMDSRTAFDRALGTSPRQRTLGRHTGGQIGFLHSHSPLTRVGAWTAGPALQGPARGSTQPCRILGLDRFPGFAEAPGGMHDITSPRRSHRQSARPRRRWVGPRDRRDSRE